MCNAENFYFSFLLRDFRVSENKEVCLSSFSKFRVRGSIECELQFSSTSECILLSVQNKFPNILLQIKLQSCVPLSVSSNGSPSSDGSRWIKGALDQGRWVELGAIRFQSEHISHHPVSDFTTGSRGWCMSNALVAVCQGHSSRRHGLAAGPGMRGKFIPVVVLSE